MVTPPSAEGINLLPFPCIATSRLRLRPFSIDDAEDVYRLAGDRRIAATTVNIPHPYPRGAAEQWIQSLPRLAADGKALTLALACASTARLVGSVSLLRPHKADSRSDLAYWVGVDYWNCGYCTEAVQALMAHAYASLGLTRFTAQCMSGNGGSARVMQKCGLLYEGTLKRHLLKNGVLQDMQVWGRNFPERASQGPAA
jgi:RimJ/RimL family protein N-acetyltransferase